MKWFLPAFLMLLVPGMAFGDYGLHAGGHFGFGKMGNNGNDANQSRSMGTFDLQAMPGFRLYNRLLLIGLLVDLRFISQLSDDNGLSPFSGRSFLVGPGAALDLPLGKFLFSWDMRARHNYTGPDTTLKGSGFHFLFGYKVAGNLCVDIEYVITRYNAVELGNIETGLGDSAIHHRNLGFGLSWTY